MISATALIVSGLLLNSTGADRIGDEAWLNPALQPLRLPQSECSGTLGYFSDYTTRQVNSTAGNGYQGFGAQADAYIHTSGSTIWGNAGYANGMILSPLWNETGDTHHTSPYILADSIGGNLNFERYSFTGGYGRIGRCVGWGVEGGYTAVLSYRRVDPRPRNVSGDLTLKSGISMRIPYGYLVAASAGYNRYRLSTDVSFVNETGETKLFHLTGLGTHYARFDGTGRSVFNDCHTGLFTLNLIPQTGNGIFLNANYSFMKMRHVINDLNKLPMATLSEGDFLIEAGYKETGEGNRWRWGVGTKWEATRRHGTENIFGDATSGSFPQIGSLTLYADNKYAGIIKGYVGYTNSNLSLWLTPQASWEHQRIVYLSPRRDWLDEHLSLTIRSEATWVPSRRSIFQGGIGWYLRTPTSSHLSIPGLTYAGIESSLTPEDKALTQLVNDDYTSATSTCNLFVIRAEYLYCINRRIAIGINASYQHSSYSCGIIGNGMTVGIKVNF